MGPHRASPRDLFGEIPLTLDDVLAWMLGVPGIAPASPRFGYYVRNWRVIEKIPTAKLEDTFEATMAPGPAPPLRLAAALSAASSGGPGRVRAQSPHHR